MVTGEDESDDLATKRGNRRVCLIEFDLRLRLEKKVAVGLMWEILRVCLEETEDEVEDEEVQQLQHLLLLLGTEAGAWLSTSILVSQLLFKVEAHLICFSEVEKRI